jgi:hypothetical protein
MLHGLGPRKNFRAKEKPIHRSKRIGMMSRMMMLTQPLFAIRNGLPLGTRYGIRKTPQRL